MKSRLLLFGVFILLNACAGQQKKEADAVKTAPTLTTRIEIAPAEYTFGVGWYHSKDASKKCTAPKESPAPSANLSSAPLGAVKLSLWKNWTENGVSCLGQKSWENAEKWGSLLMEKEPASPWGAYILSLSSEGRNQASRALWMIELAIKKAPTVGAFYLQKARLLWKQKEYREAALTLRAGVESDPRFIENHQFLGQIFYRDQEFEKASDLFAQVIALRPNDEIALNGLAECHIQNGHLQAAVQTFESGLAHYPKRIDWRLRQAYVLDELLHNYPEALSRYTRIEDLVKKGGTRLTFNITEKISVLKKTISARAEETRAPAQNSLGPTAGQVPAGGKKQ